MNEGLLTCVRAYFRLIVSSKGSSKATVWMSLVSPGASRALKKREREGGRKGEREGRVKGGRKGEREGRGKGSGGMGGRELGSNELWKYGRGHWGKERKNRRQKGIDRRKEAQKVVFLIILPRKISLRHNAYLSNDRLDDPYSLTNTHTHMCAYIQAYVPP